VLRQEAQRVLLGMLLIDPRLVERVPERCFDTVLDRAIYGAIAIAYELRGAKADLLDVLIELDGSISSPGEHFTGLLDGVPDLRKVDEYVRTLAL
jgi:hypothetical protein